MLPSSLKKIGEYAFYCSQLIHNNDNITPKNAARNELRHATCIAPLYFFVRKKAKTQQIIYGKTIDITRVYWHNKVRAEARRMRIKTEEGRGAFHGREKQSSTV